MRLSPVVGLAMVLAIACSSGPTAPKASPTAVPGTLTLSGSIVSNQDRVPIAGATFEASQTAVPVPVTTDAAGQFAAGGLAKGMGLVAVNATGYLTHRTKGNLTDSRTGFVLDLIPNSPPFDLEFYRELARGKFDGPMAETRPWTMNPSFYFQTVSADTGVPVRAAILDKLERMFVAAVP